MGVGSLKTVWPVRPERKRREERVWDPKMNLGGARIGKLKPTEV